jgi:hypothetical protein
MKPYTHQRAPDPASKGESQLPQTAQAVIATRPSSHCEKLRKGSCRKMLSAAMRLSRRRSVRWRKCSTHSSVRTSTSVAAPTTPSKGSNRSKFGRPSPITEQ